MFSCDNVITIPQYRDTCWFNAILMAIFYSQHSRKLLYNHFEGKTDKFSKIMNDIIKHNYIRTEQAIKYFEFMHPENILKYINADKTELFKKIKTTKKYSYFVDSFLPFFIKSLDKNVLDIIIYDDNFYANLYTTIKSVVNYDEDKSDTIFSYFYDSLFSNKSKKLAKQLNFDISKFTGIDTKDVSDPDYIIVNKITIPKTRHAFLSNYRNIFYKLIKSDAKLLEPLNLKTYGINIEGLLDLNDEIVHNGNKYILDSVILDNFNSVDIRQGHSIAGITCKNNRYIYNGWMRTTKDPAILNDLTKNYGNDKIPCELMKFNWDVKEDYAFCLNRQLCKLDNYDLSRKKDLCFSFNYTNDLTLIYVKATPKSSVDINISPSSDHNVSLPSLKTKSSDFSELEFVNDLEKNEYIEKRKNRKEKQEKFKRKFKGEKVSSSSKSIKSEIKLSFIQFNSNYYYKSIDEYLNYSSSPILQNPDKILIYNYETDYLGISYIKKLEYLLNVNNYSNLALKENKEDDTLNYNSYIYKLIREDIDYNEREYQLIDIDAKKIYNDESPKLKEIKEFTNTNEELLNFKKNIKTTMTYLQDIVNLLDITVEKPEKEKILPGQKASKLIYIKNTYIDCILTTFFNNKNSTIEELFFKKQLKNENAITIRNAFKSYYETKNFNRIELLEAIQIYYNDFISQNPEYPIIRWAKGKYNFTDLIILLQIIFNFNKIKILLSYNEKFKIITKQESTIKTIKISKISAMLKPKIGKLALQAIIMRLSDNYKCYYKFNNKWYDNNKIIENITKTIINSIKIENYKIVSCIYY
jgi:hypothetical protein